MDIKHVVAAGVAGVGIGYYVARQHLEKEYYTRLAQSTDEAREFYENKYRKKAEEDLVKASEAMSAYSGVSVGPSVLQQELRAATEELENLINPVVEQKLLSYVEQDKADFPEEDHSEDLDGEGDEVFPVEELSPEMKSAEKTAREEIRLKPIHKKPERVAYNKIAPSGQVKEPVSETKVSVEPYEITAEQFIANSKNHKQFSFTYFQGDGVLANEKDEALGESLIRDSLGVDILRDLKTGLDDVYVRNEVGKWDFEIARSSGKYSEEVEVTNG